MARLDWVAVSENESHAMSDLRMCSVEKIGDVFKSKIILNGRVEFTAQSDDLEDGKLFIEQFVFGELNETNHERGGDGMARRKRAPAVAVAEKEEEKKKVVKAISGMETTSLGDLMKKNAVIKERVERNISGGSEDLTEAVEAYIIEEDNTWDDVRDAILEIANGIDKKIKFKAEGSEGEGIVLKIGHNDRNKIKLFDVNEDQYIQNPLGLAIPLAKAVADAPTLNVSGGWKLGNIIKVNYPKFYGVLSKNSEGKEGSALENCIKLSKTEIEISVDLPLSMMFGTLSIEKLKAMLGLLVEEYEVRYDTIGGMKKFLKETIKTGKKKLEEDKKQLTKDIDSFQNKIVETVRSLRTVQDNLSVLESRKTPEKILEEFKPLLNKVIKDEIVFNDDGSFTVIYPNIKLNHRGYDYEFGDIAVKLYSNGTVRGVPELTKQEFEKEQKRRVAGFITPHLRDTGEFCLGNYTQVLADFLLRSELATTISLMHEFLSSYNEASPYLPIAAWKKDADYVAGARS